MEFKRGAVSAALHLYTAAIRRLEADTEATETELDELEITAEQLQGQQEKHEKEGVQQERQQQQQKEWQETQQGQQEKGQEEGQKNEQVQQQQEHQEQEEHQQQQDAREHPAAHFLPEEKLLRYKHLLQQLQQLDEMHAILKSNRLARGKATAVAVVCCCLWASCQHHFVLPLVHLSLLWQLMLHAVVCCCYCRALCHLHYSAFDAAVADGTDAIRVNPKYAKASPKRRTLFPKLKS